MRKETLKILEDDLRKCWSKEKESFLFNGIKYRVGKMSYGQYFLEPDESKGEMSAFNRGTIWLIKNKQNYFVMDSMA